MPTNNQPWICRHIRATVFHAQLKRASDNPLIQPIFGMEPEAIEMRPQAFVRSEIAQMGPGKINASSAMNRSDWIWQVADDAEDGVGLGSPDEVLESFVPKIGQWIENQTDIVRIAVGGQFLIKVGSKEEGYQKLDELIDELSVDPATSDLMYQINRPVVKNVCGRDLQVNRVFKWACKKFTVGSFSLSGEQAQVASEVVARYASCELDFNSDKDNSSPFSAEMMRGILGELVDNYRVFLRGA